MKRKYLITLMAGFALGISLSALFITLQINNPFQESNYEEHSRCFYFNDETECGKTRYCASHVSEEFCNEVGGEWLLETQEREMIEWAYWMMLESKEKEAI